MLLRTSNQQELTCFYTAWRSFQTNTKKYDVLDDSLSNLIWTLFIYSLNTYLTNTYYPPDTILDARDIAVNKTHGKSYPHGVHIPMKTDNN